MAKLKSIVPLTVKEKKRARELQLVKRSIAVTAMYMLAELVIGYQFNVLSLVADSYHMMNDIAAFVVQLYAAEIATLDRPHMKSTTAFSYGFGRVEFLANLIQGVLLLALCLTLSLESMQRFYSSESITLPPIVVGMGLAGLVWNLVMFRLFEGNEGGEEDEEEGEERSLCHPLRYRRRLGEAAVYSPYCLGHAASSAQHQARVERSLSRATSHASHGSHSSHDSHDRHGCFEFFNPSHALAIHALGDAAGNFAVIVDGVVSWLVGPKNGYLSGRLATWSGAAYVDPLCSLVVVYVILVHAFPLVTKSSFALMHAFDPKKTSEIKDEFERHDWLPSNLAHDVDVELQDLHVWKLTETSQFATASLLVHGDGHVHLSAADIVEIEEAAKRVLHDVAPPQQITVEVHLPSAPPRASLPPRPHPSQIRRASSVSIHHPAVDASHSLPRSRRGSVHSPEGAPVRPTSRRRSVSSSAAPTRAPSGQRRGSVSRSRS